RDSFNAVFIEGEAVGELMLYGRGAGGRPTASAVLGDLIDAAHNLRAGGGGRAAVRARAHVHPIDQLRAQYYISIDVLDRPGLLAEGGTPLLPAPRLSERVGARVLLKVEGANPTGSFKDRGMTVAISKAVESGAKAVVCASTGNTSASAAAYAARAGLTCAVL